MEENGMLKLIKYEFQKQAVAKWVLLILSLALEGFYLFSLYFGTQKALISCIIGLSVMACCGLGYLCFESIIVFSKDLREKTSYILFLVPRTSYEIILAKLIYAGLGITIGVIFYTLLAGIDLYLWVDNQLVVRSILERLSESLQRNLQMQINWQWVCVMGLSTILSWLRGVTTAFFVIALGNVLMPNSKGKKIFNIFLFIGICFIFQTISRWIFGDPTSLQIGFCLLESLWVFVCIVLTYVATAWILEKKISL